MRKDGVVVTCFDFTYKRRDYYVTVTDYPENEKPDPRALVELCFMRKSNIDNSLTVSANSWRIMTTPQVLREFFGIAYSVNIGDILQQFYERFGEFVPAGVRPLRDDQKNIVIRQLGVVDRADDPNKIYCIGVKRNGRRIDGSLGRRSIFNSQKTRLLRNRLYEKFKRDPNLSFCYSTHASEEKTDEQILEMFSRREKHSPR